MRYKRIKQTCDKITAFYKSWLQTLSYISQEISIYVIVSYYWDIINWYLSRHYTHQTC